MKECVREKLLLLTYSPLEEIKSSDFGQLPTLRWQLSLTLKRRQKQDASYIAER